jgi:hypothetical protein
VTFDGVLAAKLKQLSAMKKYVIQRDSDGRYLGPSIWTTDIDCATQFTITSALEWAEHHIYKVTIIPYFI